ncbi:50S ribosomal protein L21 [Kosmotoga pacifica]|uniref:Large ribosomal subunit protein bL21 n=1 Tax=Kosmotoga pacifica TaxID=1330330 RepID=A0A0G2ZEZ4_9BACT|nr:50S ribosomal protein L21 [Kosmotoga pacifica]AKI98119.1 50S ribosomal protein L21 [Kosmotoga pacifica]
MYAVIETSGKQYRVTEGMTLCTEKQRDYSEGDRIEFDRVLLLRDDSGTKVGKPYLEGVKVIGKVVRHGRDKKIRIVKFRPRKNYDRVNGHRQWFTEILIEKIEY